MSAAFRGDDITGNLDAWTDEMMRKAELAMQDVMAALEGWAKSEHGHPGVARNTRPPVMSKSGEKRNAPHNAPYWDLTSNTTNSIRGEVVEVTREIISGVLSAGMEYDIYLELAHNGKWAFLWPTIENHKDDIMRLIANRMKI